jgi:hypothetical protein
MTCPSEELLVAIALGEVSPGDAAGFGEHLKNCERCATLTREHAGLASLLRMDATPVAADAQFVQLVMGQCAASPSVASPTPLHRRPWVYGLAAVAAASALWLMRPSGHSAPDVVAARGTSSREVAPVTPDVLLLRDKTLLPIEHAELHPGDGLVVRYWNSSDEPVYLAVFAIDANSAVHWVYPAYLDATQNPTSIRLDRAVEGKIMGEAVEPEEPAAGPLRIVALLTSEPLSVRQVEAQLAQRLGRLTETFPNARVHEWSCTWNAR